MIRNGKNPKWVFFLKGYLRECLPLFLSQKYAKKQIAKSSSRFDYNYIIERVYYFNKLNQPKKIIDAVNL